jgi:hypothetical protein
MSSGMSAQSPLCHFSNNAGGAIPYTLHSPSSAARKARDHVQHRGLSRTSLASVDDAQVISPFEGQRDIPDVFDPAEP